MPALYRSLFRRLAKSPGFALVTVLMLALGIGANTAIFSVLNGVLVKPLPFHESDRLAGIWLSAPGLNIPELNASPAQYFLYGEEAKTFDHMSLWVEDSVVVTGLAEPEQVEALNATHSLLTALQVNPAIGRAISKQDEIPNSPKVALLSHGYWQRKFGGDPNALGKQILIDAEPHQIIGVLPQSFRFLNQSPQLITTLRFDRSKVFVGNFSYQAIARLKPGVTWQEANTDVARMLPILMRSFPAPPGFSMKMLEDAKLAPNVKPLKDEVVGNIGTLLWVLMGTIGIVLLIACANVANLMLVRAEGRQQELAVRAALGASRADITRELLAESLLLGIAGGIAGIGVAYLGLRLLIPNVPAGMPRVQEIAMDPIVLVFALVVSLLAGLLFGLIPVFKYAGPRVNLALREGGSRNASASRERHRARSLLVVMQVALALVLLVGASLMIRTFQTLIKVNPGFRNPEQVLTLGLGVPYAQEKNMDRVLEMYREMRRRISEIPGVEAVAWGNSITMDGNRSFDPVFAEDRTYKSDQLPPIRAYKYAAPGLFHALGNPLVAGRDFTWTDLQNRAPVVVISENMAREMWGNPGNAIGKRVRESPKGVWREVIGVVGDERHHGIAEPAPTIIYWPVITKGMWGEGDEIRRYAKFAIRSQRTGSQSFTEEVKKAIWGVNPGIPISQIRTLKTIQERSMARTSFTLVMLGIAGAMALLLGAVGIYGVISYSVLQRTREIGIRTALGATGGSVQGMFLRHGLLLSLAGVAVGMAVSFGLSRWMASLLYEVSPRDPLTFALVPVGLVVAAMLASYFPSRRATRVDPAVALRSE